MDWLLFPAPGSKGPPLPSPEFILQKPFPDRFNMYRLIARNYCILPVIREDQAVIQLEPVHRLGKPLKFTFPILVVQFMANLNRTGYGRAASYDKIAFTFTRKIKYILSSSF